MSRASRVRIVVVALALATGVGLLATVEPKSPSPTVAPTAPLPPRPQANSRAEQLRAEALPPELEPLRAIAVPKVPPQPGDWLAEHPEDGQSVSAHASDCQPVRGRVIYLVPVGLDPAGEVVAGRLEKLLAAHFQLPVKRLEALSATLAGKSEREGPLGRQWLTGDILEALRARRPEDAAAVMGVTSVDLYPHPDWNFVFGEASYDERVGVMSLARGGELATEPVLVIERAYATGMHEIGHMLQVLHCIAWECPMNGCNHQEESDSRPLEPCPHCLAKLVRATGLDVAQRWSALRAEFADAGLARGVTEIDRELAAMHAPDAGP